MHWSLRLSLIHIALPLIAAHQDVLFTSSVSYCAPPKAILVEQLDLKYFASNESVSFNVTAASVEANLTVSANILLNFYGKKPVDLTIDFCHALGNVLCPLPQYNFSGEGSVPLPSDVNVQSQIPSIAYHIPDLEAYAQVILSDVSSGEVKACVQTTLSNGWSTRQPGVTWATGGLGLLFLGAALHDLTAGHHGIAVHGFLDLLQAMQFICVTGLMDLNYPVLYLSFTLNFAWSIGLVPGLGFLQRSINDLRIHTGGTLDPAVSPEGTVNRKLSPYNDRTISQHARPSKQIVDSSGISGATNQPATVLSASDSLQAGIATYTNSLRISERNAFLTIFFTILILLAIIALALLIYLLIGSATRWRIFPRPALRITLLNGSLILGCMLAYPVMAFSFYQWTLHDSWFAVLSSVLTMILWLASWTPAAIITLVSISQTDVARSSMIWRFTHLSFFRPYRISRNWYTTVCILIILVTAALVGFAQSNGEVQVAGLIVINLLSLAAFSVLKPYGLRRLNLLAFSQAFMRLVAITLLVPFIPRVGVKPIPRVVIGIVLAVLLSVMIGVLLVAVMVNTWVQLRSKSLSRHHLVSHHEATNVSSEKLQASDTNRSVATSLEEATTSRDPVASKDIFRTSDLHNIR